MKEEKIENSTKPVRYRVLENELEKSYRIRVNIPFAKFKDVFIDGVLLSKDQYLAKEGSTIIQLKKEYVKTLKQGNHTIKIVAEDGEVSQSFFVQRRVSVKTSDSNTWVLLIGFMSIGLWGLFLAMKYRFKVSR